MISIKQEIDFKIILVCHFFVTYLESSCSSFVLFFDI